jgi:hypothetical protein
MIQVTDTMMLNDREINERFVRATGPGGQNVPLDAELMAEHTVEATSGRAEGTISHRDELWDRCYRELMGNTHARLAQEIARLGGHYDHVRGESIDIRHDDSAGEAWLHGHFSYMEYRRPSPSR